MAAATSRIWRCCAGAALRAVAAVPAPPTAGQPLRRFTRRQCHAAVAAAGSALDAELGLDRHAAMALDGDATEAEVGGRQNECAAFHCEGPRDHATQATTWAERQRVPAAEPRRDHAAPTRRAVALRPDRDHDTLDLLQACRRRRVRLAVSVPRRRAAERGADRPAAWQPASAIPGAEVAETTSTPVGWRHQPVRLLIRRAALDPATLSRSPTVRRQRTIPAEQLALASAGAVDVVCRCRFIVTDHPEPAATVEQWQRQRAVIEERIRHATLGCGLLRLPLDPCEPPPSCRRTSVTTVPPTIAPARPRAAG